MQLNPLVASLYLNPWILIQGLIDGDPHDEIVGCMRHGS